MRSMRNDEPEKQKRKMLKRKVKHGFLMLISMSMLMFLIVLISDASIKQNQITEQCSYMIKEKYNMGLHNVLNGFAPGCQL